MDIHHGLSNYCTTAVLTLSCIAASHWTWQQFHSSQDQNHADNHFFHSWEHLLLVVGGCDFTPKSPHARRAPPRHLSHNSHWEDMQMETSFCLKGRPILTQYGIAKAVDVVIDCSQWSRQSIESSTSCRPTYLPTSWCLWVEEHLVPHALRMLDFKSYSSIVFDILNAKLSRFK